MKVTVEEKKPEDEAGKYPWIGQHKVNKNLLVLFAREKVGTILQVSHDGATNVGYHSDDWDMDYFKPFQGKITLENGD